jgi:hypothetical protein
LKLNFGAVLAIIAIAFLMLLYFLRRLDYTLEVGERGEEDRK